MDIGAAKSVVGLKDLPTVAAFLGRSVKRKSNFFNRSCFADTTFNSLEKFMILAIPPGIPSIYVSLDVVLAGFPALLGMNFLDRESITADIMASHLTKREAFVLKMDCMSTMMSGVCPYSAPNGVMCTRRSMFGNALSVLNLSSPSSINSFSIRLHRNFSHFSNDGGVSGTLV